MNENHDINVNDLARYIFIKNRFDKKIILNIKNGINNTNDLYHLILDLFLKGILLLHGIDDQFELNNITIQQITLVVNKLQNANIYTYIETNELTDEIRNIKNIHQRVIKESFEISRNMDSEELYNYKFNIILNDMLYQIHFYMVD